MIRHKVGLTNALFACWVWAFSATLPRAVMAQSRFSQDIKLYDWESLGWAALMAVFGGALRTIFTLATDDKVVTSVWREGWKDAIVAIIAGLITYIGVEAIRASHWLPVPSEVRFAVIVFAGWSRLSFFGWLNSMGTRVTESITRRMENMVQAPPAVPPTPAAKPKPFNEV